MHKECIFDTEKIVSMSQRFWLSVLVWIMSLPALMGQADSSLVYLRARLLNTETGEAIPFAHVLLKSKRMGLTSDNDGYFDISHHKNDSLIISSIGFEELRVAIKDMRLDSSINIILLNPKIYMLDEVQITQYPTYEELVKIIINPVFTENEKGIFRAYEHLESAGLSSVAGESGGKGVGGPVSAIYNLFSREEKNRKKYIKLKEEEDKDIRLGKKLNAEIIEHITGLTDSVAIVQFIKYCNFSDQYLENVSEYGLYKLIMLKYKAFEESKN